MYVCTSALLEKNKRIVTLLGSREVGQSLHIKVGCSRYASTPPYIVKVHSSAVATLSVAVGSPSSTGVRTMLLLMMMMLRMRMIAS